MPRRALVLLVAAALIGAPAAILRALCVGRSCVRPQSASAEVPFCSLQEAVREPLRRGFREGRSPEVLAVSAATPVRGRAGTGRRGPAWPSVASPGSPEVPLVFWGEGVSKDAEIPPHTGLDEVAPTIADIVDLDRSHPEVRSGEAIEGVAGGSRPRLVLVVVLKGVGTSKVRGGREHWVELGRLMGSGAATLEATSRSLPADPAAVMTTIGTGGLPSQHGITGARVRNDAGRLTPAWGPDAPVSVIAGLGDDLDHQLHQRPRIGLVGTDVTDRGLIGGNWYVDHDRDDVRPAGSDPVGAARRILDLGYGADRVPDLLGVALEGSPRHVDTDLAGIVRAARSASKGSLTVVVAGTGGFSGGSRPAVSSAAVARRVERSVPGGEDLVEAPAVGGLFLDQRALAAGSISEDEIIAALRDMEAGDGESLFADAFPAIAVSFARYC